MSVIQKLLFSLLPKPRSHHFEIYTDGGLKRGQGAWAFVLLRDGVFYREASGVARQTTSIRMEWTAAIEALRSLPPNSKGTLFSDCRVLINALNGTGPDRSHGPDGDLVGIASGLNRSHRITWKWVKAHSGDPHNDRCDALCTAARGP